MGKIKKLKDVELVGGTEQSDVYPITSTKAIYDENNKRLDNIIAELQKSADSSLETENKTIVGSINELKRLRDKGYLFKGVATPDTNPGVVKQKVFYIANGKGTYKNFGGINVDEDEVVLLIFDEIWQKLTTGIAAYETTKVKFDKLEQKFDSIDSQQNMLLGKILGQVGDSDVVVFDKKSFANIIFDGTKFVRANSTYNSYIFAIKKTVEYHIEGKAINVCLLDHIPFVGDTNIGSSIQTDDFTASSDGYVYLGVAVADSDMSITITKGRLLLDNSNFDNNIKAIISANANSVEHTSDFYYNNFDKKVGEVLIPNKSELNTYSCFSCDVKKGDILLLKGKNEISDYARTYCVTDNNNVITRFHRGDIDDVLIIMDSESHVYINYYNITDSDYVKVVRQDAFNELETNVYGKTVELDCPNVVNISNRAYKAVEELHTYEITCTKDSNKTINEIRILAYNDSTLLTSTPLETFTHEGQKFIVTIPTSCKKIVFFHLLSGTTDTHFVIQDVTKKSIQSMPTSYKGKNVVCLGDSVTQYQEYNPERFPLGYSGKGYPEYIATYLECNVVNGGMGGTRLQRRAPIDTTTSVGSWAALDIVSVAHAIASGDWSQQVEAANKLKQLNEVNYIEIVDRLSKVNWYAVDTITIQGGVNDFTATYNVPPIGDIDSNDETTSCGALNEIIRLICSTYKHINVVFITSAPKYIDSREPSKWSNVYKNDRNVTLEEFMSVLSDVCAKQSVNVYDMYHKIGWNIHNESNFYDPDDNDVAHPYKGFKWMGRKIAAFLVGDTK